MKALTMIANGARRNVSVFGEPLTPCHDDSFFNYDTSRCHLQFSVGGIRGAPTYTMPLSSALAYFIWLAADDGSDDLTKLRNILSDALLDIEREFEAGF